MTDDKPTTGAGAGAGPLGHPWTTHADVNFGHSEKVCNLCLDCDRYDHPSGPQCHFEVSPGKFCAQPRSAHEAQVEAEDKPEPCRNYDPDCGLYGDICRVCGFTPQHHAQPAAGGGDEPPMVCPFCAPVTDPRARLSSCPSHIREANEHALHMTDGLWHDGCWACLARRGAYTPTAPPATPAADGEVASLKMFHEAAHRVADSYKITDTGSALHDKVYLMGQRLERAEARAERAEQERDALRASHAELLARCEMEHERERCHKPEACARAAEIARAKALR